MDATPSLSTRFMAAIRGEISSADLEAYRRAGSGVDQLLESARTRRLEMLCDGTNAWTVPDATQFHLLATWVAYACQTLGDDFVDADYAADRQTVGYVPPVTAEQAAAMYGEVGSWLSAGREAEANVDYARRLSSPVPLPAWSTVEPCPVPHLAATLSAAAKLGPRVEALLVDVQAADLSEEHKRSLRNAEQLIARGSTFLDRAERLRGTAGVSAALHEDIELAAKEAVQSFFVAGQLLSMPKLAAKLTPGVTPVGKASRLPAPGEAGFDMWSLTDPVSRPQWQRDPAAVAAITALWAHDPQPEATVARQEAINDALESGDVVRSSLGHYFCCPWAPIYQAVHPVTLGGVRVRRGEKFTFDVSAEEVLEGGEFTRRIFVADFMPTTNIDYCNPEAGGHDD